MKNYEKICAYINAGHYAIAEYDDKKIKFTDITQDGKLCYHHGVSDEKRINTLQPDRIYPLPRPIPQYKVGDKVVVLENIKELEAGRHFTVGEVCVVLNNRLDDGTMRIGKVDSTSSWYVLPHCVAPYFDDEVEEMTVEQICKALGKNIKIVK